MKLTDYRMRIVFVLFLIGMVAVYLLYTGKRSARVDLPQCAHWAVVRAAERVGQPVSASDVYTLLPPNEAGHSESVRNRFGLKRSQLKKTSHFNNNGSVH